MVLFGFAQGIEDLKLVFFEEIRGGKVGLLASELLCILNAPRHHQINGQAVLEALAVFELAVLDPAPALQRTVELLDLPPTSIPLDLLPSLFVRTNRHGRPEHPLDGLATRRRIQLGDVHGPQAELSEPPLDLRRLELDLRKAHLQLGDPRPLGCLCAAGRQAADC